MDHISEKGRLLDVAKEKGIEILENSKNQNIRIITNNFNSTEEFDKKQKGIKRLYFKHHKFSKK